jgi:putative ABC transport system permease protein
MRTGISWLDVKLGARMLIKHPGLTLVGGLGMAVAIAIGAGAFAFFYSFLYPRLSLDEGDRIVAVENWDVRRNNESRRSLHDFAVWREELRTVRDVSAFRNVWRNVVAPDGTVEPVRLAELTASSFRVARVAPRLGRPLVEDDEQPGAPPVVVIGHDVWRTRFGADSGAIGQPLRLGNVVHTVVGVMPEGFAFPVNHSYWLPLRLTPADFPRGEGPELYVFGRLAPGVTWQEAQAELDALGRRAAAAFPATNADLRPQVLNYTYPMSDIQDVSLWEVTLMQLTVSLLLVVVAVNVAILVYARTASRRGEIAVRTALGASRRRIVAQLFAEALMLAGVSAVAGLALARAGLGLVHRVMVLEGAGETPFWMDYGIPAPTVLYVVGLAVLAAVIAGVLPALGATGRGVQESLRHLGGGSGPQLGRTWNVLIVAQVAFVVAAIPVTLGVASSEIGEALNRPGFAADEFLVAYLSVDPEPTPGMDAAAYAQALGGRFADRQAEVVRRLEAEPWVAGVSLSTGLPGQDGWSRVEVDGPPGPSGSTDHTVVAHEVEVDYFAMLGSRVLAGRPLGPADADTTTRAVVVNQAFVRSVLGGGSVLGRRLRYVSREERELGAAADTVGRRWYEVVGVMGDLQENPVDPALVHPELYHVAVPGQLSRAMLMVRVRGEDPAAHVERLRQITAGVDPSLRLVPRSLGALYHDQAVAVRLMALVVGLILLSVLLLSAAGIYALMSFTVSQRRKEIGIRSALGADPRRILGSIFSRAVRQLGVGVGVGLLATVLLDLAMDGEVMYGRGAILLPAVCVIMIAVGLLAALGPARRGLRIQPMEALREE